MHVNRWDRRPFGSCARMYQKSSKTQEKLTPAAAPLRRGLARTMVTGPYGTVVALWNKP